MLNFSNSIVLSAYVRCVCAYVSGIYVQPDVRSRFEDCTVPSEHKSAYFTA